MIVIDDISLSDPVPFRFTVGRENLEAGMARRLRITLKNTSSDATYHVVACRRVLSFDAGAKLLTVGFARNAEPTGDAHHVILPTLVAVEPGEVRALETNLELELSRAEFIDGRVKVLTQNATDWERLKVVITSAPSPFRPVFTQSANDIHAAFSRWGKDIVREVSRTELRHLETEGVQDGQPR